MSPKKSTIEEIIIILQNCSTLVGSTLERMSELLTHSLLFHPGIEERGVLIEQLYINVINFLDDISTIVIVPTDKECASLVPSYDYVFDHLKTVANLMVDLNTLLSHKHIEMQLPSMDVLYALNQTVADSIGLFNRIIQPGFSRFKHLDKIQLTELDISSQKLYRVMLKYMMQETQTLKDEFSVYIMADKMKEIVSHCCIACKKMYAVLFEKENIKEK